MFWGHRRPPVISRGNNRTGESGAVSPDDKTFFKFREVRKGLKIAIQRRIFRLKIRIGMKVKKMKKKKFWKSYGGHGRPPVGFRGNAMADGGGQRAEPPEAEVFFL